MIFAPGYQNDYLLYTCQNCPRAAGTLESYGIVGLAGLRPQFEEIPERHICQLRILGRWISWLLPGHFARLTL